jgi:hypothetical protein
MLDEPGRPTVRIWLDAPYRKFLQAKTTNQSSTHAPEDFKIRLVYLREIPPLAWRWVSAEGAPKLVQGLELGLVTGA